ncbi:hypothetical protein [Vibrio cortegadensis]|uniref:hypothetical protein n=1 Tax=Vibrio cortegadensis TaxID=1328770 RepID=UPI0021C290E9|nr:hypothetical protein [Vibrio cortegadensis]
MKTFPKKKSIPISRDNIEIASGYERLISIIASDLESQLNKNSLPKMPSEFEQY